jgi:lysozyme
MIPTTIIDQLKRDEGFRAKPYRDTKGNLTIGYGTNLDAGVDDPEACYLLGYRTQKARENMLAALPWVANLPDARFGAMLNLTYNMEIGVLLEFQKFLAAAEANDWDTAAQELINSKAHEEEPSRIERLALQIRSNQWI